MVYPKKLSRYVITEFTKVFLVSLTCMAVLMVLVGIVQEAIREGLTPLTILKLIPYAIPNALCFAIPGTILFSVCNVLGRMSGSNEIVAIKSLGISPMVVVWPILVFSFVLSLLTVVLNDYAVSWGRQGIYRVVLHSVQNTIYAKLNADKSYRRGNVSIAVSDVQGQTLKQLFVEIHAKNVKKPILLTAEEARLECDTQKNVLVITTKNGFVKNDGMTLSIDEDRFELPLENVTKKRDKSKSPSNLPMRLISAELKSQKLNIEKQKNELAVIATFQTLGGDVIGLTDANWVLAKKDLENAIYRKHRLRAEPWRRWANGFSCLFFALVGAPLAIRLHRSDFWTIFALAFVPILLLYYPVLMLGVEQAKSGRMPPYSVWLGNIVMLIIGLRLLYLVKRH